MSETENETGGYEDDSDGDSRSRSRSRSHSRSRSRSHSRSRSQSRYRSRYRSGSRRRKRNRYRDSVSVSSREGEEKREREREREWERERERERDHERGRYIQEVEPDWHHSQRQESPEDILLRECCLPYEHLSHLCENQRTSEPVIHLETTGQNNILSYSPRIYKHQLLKQGQFRQRIIEYYKNANYKWVDIVVLNRHYWKIFLFQHDP